MLGLMQDWPLLIHRIIDHAAIQHPAREIVSRSVEGPIHRTDYATLRRRSLRLAKRLEREGVRRGDRVGTLAWNTWRHLEIWYGATGLGAIYHTVNPRLFDDQIVYIVNHAADRLLFLDLTFVPLVERIANRLETIERFVILTDAANMPETSLKGAVAYEDYIAEADEDFAWLSFDEQTAAGMCYTSGTTGDPKGVVYSHRSNVLHSLIVNGADFLGLSAKDVAMPVVPFFHANGWSFAFSAPMAGAKLVLPGPKLDGASLAELLIDEKVTISAAVPTIWFSLLQNLEATGAMLPDLQRVVIGGSACPRAVTKTFRDVYGAEVIHAWGMTEMSPLGSLCNLKPDYGDIDGERWLDLKEKVGFPPFGVEMKIVDDENRPLPWDGVAFGRLKVRGPAVARAYFHRDDEIIDADGFFDTGDVATIDPHGNMQIVDRSKDVIKSGGEWISSIDLENIAVGHPDVAEAAVIGVPHPKWDERPLLIIVPMPGRTPDKDDLIAFMGKRIAKWQLPDDVVLVEDIPHTATGKIQKTALRERFAGYRLPDA
ncbi:MAG: long-chain-fatty-acid--CoA ligase [Salinarimonadaceae bacterium]|nr:MAG: long-chain-fatty-acid--CoA ligase [Salinarimonadaceae bacterium]